MFVKYIPGNTFFHKMDPRVKALLTLAIVVFGIIFYSPLYLLIILTSLLIAWKLAGLSFKRVWKMIKPLLIFLPLILLGTAFTGVESKRAIMSKILFKYSFLKITVGSLSLGTSYLIKIFLFIFSLSLFTLTTKLGAIMRMMEMLHFPYQLSFAMTTGIRFVPTLNEEREDIMDAQRARGVKFEKESFLGKLKSRIPIMIPLITSGIRKSDNLAKAMLARGFGAKEKRTSLTELKMRKVDYLYLAIFLLIFAFGIYLRVMGYGVL